MQVAYFPKNEEETVLFTAEFRKQNVECRVYHPDGVFLKGVHGCRVGVGPSLGLQDLSEPDRAGTNLQDFDMVFQRSVWSWNALYGPENLSFYFDLLQLAQEEVNIVNPPEATVRARRKHLALAHLQREGVPVLPFYSSPSPIRNMNITNEIRMPAMIKALEGSGGIGVVYAPSEEVFGDIVSLFHRNAQVPLIQPFIPVETDLRIIVIGNQILGAIQRRGTIHKHNVTLGATTTFTPESDVPALAKDTALRAAAVLGLEISGVDLLITDHGPMVLEANPSPGFQGFQQASGIDVPAAIVSHLKSLAKR